MVVDAGPPGFGASTRNGGQVGSGNQKLPVRTLVATKGERLAIEMLREGVQMLDGIEDLVRREKIDCSFVRCGRFRGAMRPAHYDLMAREMGDLARYTGIEYAMVPKSEQHREIGTELFHGGSLLPRDASLHPGAYHAGLMTRVFEADAEIRGELPVRGITTDGQSHVVHFDGFAVHARDVLVATNGYTKDVGAFFRKRIVPVQSAQIATGPISPAIFDEIIPQRRVFGNSNRVFFYFRPAPKERRIIWGGRASAIARDPKGAAYAHLARDLIRTFPVLADVSVDHAWGGRIGYTFDDFPHLGRTPEGLFYAMGYCGTGISRSTHFGRKIALQILGKPEGRSAFDSLPFQSHSFHAFSQAGVPVVTTWSRLRDTVGF